MTTFLTIIFFIAIALLLINFWGLSIRKRGTLPNDRAEFTAQQQKLAYTDDGREIAYTVYGSENPDAPAFINMHGSGLENGFERATYDAVCQELDCRGIAISQPGCGFTEQKPGRRVVDWPSEDLAAVLDAEGIDKFYITGHSQGTPHAMAAALVFGERCLGFGLNAPLLPAATVNEIGLSDTIGTGQTPQSSTLGKFYMGWYFVLYKVLFDILSPKVPVAIIKKGLPKLGKDTDIITRFNLSLKRATVRGTSGLTWESAQDTNFDWGFDVRDIKNDNAVVWHAKDDNQIPWKQGEFLAKIYDAQYKNEAEGFGHMTYTRGPYQSSQTSMIAALLNGA